MRGAQAVEIGAGIRVGGGQQVKEQDAQTVEIAPGRLRLAGQDFRREIHRRTRRTRGRCPLRAAGSEVHQDNPAAGLAHHVLGFQVSMHQPGRVHRGKRPAQIDADSRCLPTAESAVGPQPGFESLAVDQLHPETRGTLANVGSMYGDYVEVPHLRERARLQEQALHRAVRRNVAAQQLQRDIPTQLRIVGPEHLTERPRREPLPNRQMSPRLRIRRWRSADGMRGDVWLEHERTVQFGDTRDEPEIAIPPTVVARSRRGVERGPVDLCAIGKRFQQAVVVDRLRIHRAAP